MKKIIVKVADIVGHLNKIADPALAYEWDNVGFQVGDGNREVKKILLTLDVTDNAIEKAISENADMIISHHPLIFKPLKKITDPTYLKLIKNDISVYCAHTNLDVIKKGVNHALAEKLNLTNLEFLSSDVNSKIFQIAVYVPAAEMVAVAEAVFSAGAGIIGNYADCMNDYEVSGQFTPLEGSKPVLGSTGKQEKVVERKLEFFVDSHKLNKVITAMQKAHPYETPAYAVYPQHKLNENYGTGIIGELNEELTLEELAKFVKQQLKAPFVKLWKAGKPESEKVKKIAVCGGSGSSLISKTYGRADAFVSADFTYHTVLDSRIPLIDAGHFYTENPVLENLKEMLKEFKLDIIELKPEEHEIRDQIVI